MGGQVTSPEDPRVRPGVRWPHRLGPIDRTGTEVAGVVMLLGAAVFLAVAGVVSGDGDVLLIFPAFGIPDVLFAWFRWGRWKRPARWATDLRATILLTVLTVYLAVSAFLKVRHPIPFAGVSVAVVLAGATSAIWTVRVVQDRPR